MLMNNSSDRYKSGQMIPSRRLRSCFRCWNVSKDELRELELVRMGEVHLCLIDLSLSRWKGKGIERVVSRRETFGLSPSVKLIFFYILIPRGTYVTEEDIFENKIFTNNSFKTGWKQTTHKECKICFFLSLFF